MSDTVLVTGGLGYVGGRISSALLANSRFSLRAAANRQASTIPAWISAGSVVPLDLRNDDQIAAACRGVRTVVHLAALNEIDSAADPEQALLVNTLGTMKLLRSAVSAGVERFIYFSTAHVYKAPLEGAISEQNITRPVHPYATTHRAAEDYVLAAHDQGQLTGIVLRLSNGFGAPAHASVNRWTLIANDLCRQAVTTKQLVLRSSGLQRRDFVTLTDIVRAVLHFVDIDRNRCGDGLFNLGGRCPLRIIDLTERIADRCKTVLGFRPDISRPAPRPDETSPELDYQIDKLLGTGFTLAGSIDAEIDATLRLCRDQFGAAL